jgi:hypothetical protein
MKQFLIELAALSFAASIATAQNVAPTASPTPTAPTSAAPGTETVENVVVTSQELDISREAIVPSLGATRYTVGPDRLDSQSRGEDAPFNQTMLRFPGVAQDSFGQLHVRGEHANLQYRIDDVLLPESIPGFGQVLETRFADNISLVTGALPAQFGFRTTGVIDIHTKNGAVFQQGEELGLPRSRSAFHRLSWRFLYMERLESSHRRTLRQRVTPRFCQHPEEPSIRDIQPQLVAPNPDHGQDRR